ncbi:MAG: enoyl-CoA hydratase/isomerase family protein, partial [Veillonella sp.]|nr:enoyl-CoA hydratase/isomerase family protein [Veillonella sp.]
MTFETILYTVADKVATITFNRPEVQNGFNIPMCHEILKALEAARDDASVRVIVFKAEGKVFSVGGDLVEMKRAVEENDQASLVAIAELVMQISLTMKKTPKPIVMVTDGAVAGAAFNMVLAADFCIASTNSRFIQAFVNVGLAPDAGGMYLLSRAVG